jgi:transposase InsO family protein
MAKLVKRAYFDPGQPGSFSGVDTFVNNAPSSQNKTGVLKILEKESAFTLHRPLRKTFKRNKIMSWGVDFLWQADLVDVSSLAKHNDGYKYLLTVIDVLSKYSWVVPLKTKTGAELVTAFDKIFRGGRIPTKLNTDRGGEFENRKVTSFLRSKNITFYTTRSEKKAAVVERYNKTLESRMWRYFTWANTRRYVSVLEKLVRSYNHTIHRTIGMKPVDVTHQNSDQVWSRVYADVYPRKPVVYKYKVGDTVRISKLKATFEKSYLQNWTEEIFTISECLPRDPPVYRIKDCKGELIEGSFYEAELQKVTVKKNQLYVVETVLKEKKDKVLVKWRGYPKSMNSWIAKSSLVSL